MSNVLRIERSGPVGRVWLDRPDVRNALNGALIRELAAFAAFAADAGVRAIVLGGSGKAFCAGADLAFMREVGGYTWEQNRADAETLAEMLWTLYTCPVPVVARIHGDCYAGGLGIASVCDIRVVAEGVNFSLSEARLGLLPATISPYVVRAMGEQAARRYFVTAERFGAAEAKAMGFAHEVDRRRCARCQGRGAGRRARRQRADGDPRLQEAGAGRRRPRDHARAARRDGAAHRRHPRQRRRQGRRLELPREAKTIVAPAVNLDLTQLVAIAAALGWASGLRLYAVVFLTGAAGCARLGRAAGRPPHPAEPVAARRQRRAPARRVLRRQDSRPRHRLGRAAHGDPHSRRRGARGGGLRRRPGDLDHRRALLGGGLAATSHIAKATTRAAANTSPEPFSNIALSLLGDGLVPFVLWLSWAHPVLLFATLGVALVAMVAMIWILGRFLRRAASAVALRYRRPMPPAAHSEVSR